MQKNNLETFAHSVKTQLNDDKKKLKEKLLKKTKKLV